MVLQISKERDGARSLRAQNARYEVHLDLVFLSLSASVPVPQAHFNPFLVFQGSREDVQV